LKKAEWGGDGPDQKPLDNKYTEWYILSMSKAERTRQFIVEQTAPIFNIKGYVGTSVSDMTEATGLTKGSIYGNFTDKEAVALAAFDYNWSRVQAVLQAEMERHSSNKRKLLSLVDVFDDLERHGLPPGGCPLLNTAVEAADSHPALRDKATAAFNGWKKRIVSVLDAGVASKEFREGIDAQQTAVTLIALIEGAIMISRLVGDTSLRRAVMPAVQALIDQLD
jgi:TetR/AcrR family transcriptional repressor of nem operon